jgi:hypothetical protein
MAGRRGPGLTSSADECVAAILDDGFCGALSVGAGYLGDGLEAGMQRPPNLRAREGVFVLPLGANSRAP